jgi:hypothetical protein
MLCQLIIPLSGAAEPFLRLTAGCPVLLLSGGKNKDQIRHGSSFKLPKLPVILFPFALSGL